MNNLLLRGLSADNPLGYLAALGVLRTATLAVPGNRFEMSWDIDMGHWRPRLFSTMEMGRAALIDVLEKQLRTSADLTAFRFGDNLTIKIGDFREALIRSLSSASPHNRANVDFLAAFGSDAIESRSNGKPTGQIADTDFRTMSGAGHQHFLETIRTFMEDTQSSHLDKAVFEAWKYDDPLKGHSMRWDPIDDNRYALKWGAPAKDPTKNHSGSVWGGNRLAIEALPLFPTQPKQSELKTTGFCKRNRMTALTWPIWSPPIGLPEVYSLLAHLQFQKEQPDRVKLSAMGVVEIFRSERITQGKFRNFVTPTPA